MRLNKKLAAIAITASVALTATGAFAFWTTSGAGSGSASTSAGDASAITVHQTSTTTAFYPGQSAQTLSGNFTTSSAGPVQVHTVSASLTLPAGCVAADFTVAGSPATVDQNITPAAANGSWGGITVAMNNTGVSQDG
ncbi:MAG: hypothetical protein QOJ23_5999, partial [Actinomycetota bacterium]|nr:hypothetical protein [Actinomycetota bacterium]